MEDLGEIVEELQRVEGNDSIRRGTTKRKGVRRRRNTGESQGSVQPAPNSRVHEEKREEYESDGENIQPQADGRKQEMPLIQEDYEAQFYANYRKVADEYDKEFLKKYDEDLNTTLIFAGLFSAVTSAFIVEVDSQLKPDPGGETAALLRVLIYQINKTAFGDNVPTLPQCLAISLLSAFLAMLGKQWLNRYASTDMRGSAVERSRNRQRKLDGIVTWYFDHVMESLPLLLQAALLLLGCALSRYLWDISITIALVAVGVTSFGVVFYLFVTVAGAASESCPYQTPGSHTLRYLGPKVLGAIYSVRSAIGSTPRNTFEQPWDVRTIVSSVASVADVHYPWWTRRGVTPFSRDLILKIPLRFVIEGYRLGRATVRALSTLPVGTYRIFRSAPSWLYNIYSTLQQGVGQHTTPSDFRCISWTLQTSLDKPVHLAALIHLVTTIELTGLDPTLVIDCFNAFVGCVSLSNHKLAVIQGLEQLATVSAICFFRTFCHLSVTEPTSKVLPDLLRRHRRVFPFETDFRGLPFYHTIMMIHALAYGRWDRCHPRWDDYKPSVHEHTPLARHMVEVAQAEYQRMQLRKVPRWILRFALHSLSLDPPSPASVVADCLTIVAVDLDCDVSNVTTSSDETARGEQVSSLITQRLKTMASVPTVDKFLLWSKHKAICTLFPHAIRLERVGQQEMIDTILRVAGASDVVFEWHHTWPQIKAVFKETSPHSLNRVIVLMPPHVPWFSVFNTKNAVTRWAAAASAVPYSQEVCQSIVNTLLRISSMDSLRSHVPVELWAWLKRRPSLPPGCRGRSIGSRDTVVRYVRGLGDLEILKSYLLLIWSEWDCLWTDGFREMQVLIREDFSGIGMWCHRGALVKRLDHVQEQLGRELEYFKQHNRWVDEDDIQTRKREYKHLKNVLLEADEIAMESLTHSYTAFACALPLPYP